MESVRRPVCKDRAAKHSIVVQRFEFATRSENVYLRFLACRVVYTRVDTRCHADDSKSPVVRTFRLLQLGMAIAQPV